MSRTELLKQAALNREHTKVRIPIDKSYKTYDMALSLVERKAHAVGYMLKTMPLYIGENELIVGSRTLYGEFNDPNNTTDKSAMNLCSMPEYITDEEAEYFGTRNKGSKGHYVADYSIILEKGIGGIIADAQKGIEKQKDNPNSDGRDFLNAVIIGYNALSEYIKRYAAYANELALATAGERKDELLKIKSVCEKISCEKPDTFHEALQLYWFAHIALLTENYMFMNYGRLDQVFIPFLNTCEREEAQQLIECLLLKFYDMADIYDWSAGRYNGQHNMVLGGLKRDGSDATNELSYMFLDAAEKTRLPEPQISIRFHKNSPPALMKRACELSVQGLNFIAYYNDEIFVNSMARGGVDIETARDYSFDLCQDVNFAGRGDTYMSGAVSLTDELLRTVKAADDSMSFDDFMAAYKENISEKIKSSIDSYNNWEEAVIRYNNGDKDYFISKVRNGELSADVLTSPLPITSALYHGCIETATDLTRGGNECVHKGFMISMPVIGINGIAAIKKVIYDEKRYTISTLKEALEKNYEGYEELRQRLWNSPKWANDDDYVDALAKEIIEFAGENILKYKTPRGGLHMSGVHQPHPVGSSYYLEATPEGRFAHMPVPVTLSPENGTMKNGPTAAFLSAAKIDDKYIQWNNCVMLSYFASSFDNENGADAFANLISGYFKAGGAQHQPNIINVETLRAAQAAPEKYRDITVRLWGVSAHFVDLPKNMQDEFIARFEGI